MGSELSVSSPCALLTPRFPSTVSAPLPPHPEKIHLFTDCHSVTSSCHIRAIVLTVCPQVSFHIQWSWDISREGAWVWQPASKQEIGSGTKQRRFPVNQFPGPLTTAPDKGLFVDRVPPAGQAQRQQRQACFSSSPPPPPSFHFLPLPPLLHQRDLIETEPKDQIPQLL